LPLNVYLGSERQDSVNMSVIESRDSTFTRPEDLVNIKDSQYFDVIALAQNK